MEDNGGVYLVPAFAGLSAPYWNSSARAAILGLSSQSDKRHVVRAALESIVYQIRDGLEMMKRGSGVPLSGIHADGGAIQNSFLVQFLADITSIEVRTANNPDFSPLGAALMGGLRMGVYDSIKSIEELPRSVSTFVPAMDAALVEANYHGWKEAVQRVL